MGLPLVVPVYNEAQTITQVLDRVDAIDLPGVKVEVVVVDDGSTAQISPRGCGAAARTAISLRCVGFDIEPGIAARVVQAGYRIHEVPVSYSPRRPDEGKKTAWTDGLDAVYALVRCRLVRQKGRPAARPAAGARPATMDSSG